MERKHTILLGLMGLFLAALAPGGGAYGQAIDWMADVDGILLERGPASTRLNGMGGLLLAIPDEGRELNLYDYGRNLAGSLWDGDASRAELWYRTDNAVVDLRDEQSVRTRTRTELIEAGSTFFWRVNPRRLLGAGLADERLGDRVERGDRSLVRNPTWSAFGVQQFGRFALGGRIGVARDEQSLKTADVFGIEHSSTGTRYVGAVAYDRDPLLVGLQIERQVNTIDGASHDESRFHEDEMTWKRPVGIYSGAVVWHPLEVVTGAFRGEVRRIDAREEARISWSDRMPDNPGRANLLLKVGTFEEEVRRSAFGSRWEVNPVELLRLGAEWESGQLRQTVTEGENFKGSRRGEDSKTNWTRLGAGAGYVLAGGKVQVGADGWYYRKTDEESLIGGKSKITGRTVELRTGAEWFVLDALALRAGFSRTAADADVDQPRTLLVGNGFALGIGYLPRGGLYQIDAAIQHGALDPDYQGVPSREESATVMSMGVRFLF
jgi:hypothetical protein